MSIKVQQVPSGGHQAPQPTITSNGHSVPGQSTVKTLLGIGAGNAVEWFDWAIYATFASFISGQLFSKADPTSAFLATMAIFAVGFVARPFGGAFFGLIGDKVGRKAAMTMAVGLASVGSLIIAITPTYSSIGAGASLILLVARLLQGLAHGGEMPSAQTYLAEVAPAPKRGFYSTLMYFSGTAGIVAGTLLGAILTVTLTKEQMGAFGWRIPFAVGALMGLYTLIMRSRLKETEQFEEQKSAKAAAATKGPSVFSQIMANWRQAVRVIGLTVGLTVVYYIWSVSTPAYAIANLKMDPATALWTGVAANLVFMTALPFWGKLSDRIGRRPVLLISALGAAALQFPMSSLVRGEAWQLFVAMSVMLIFIAASASIVPAVYAELFPTAIRTIGVAIPYAIAVAAFGGTAAFLQAGFNAWFGIPTGGTIFAIYSIVLLLISALTIYKMPESVGKDLRG
ncbi:MFS transporter [Paeniglutamicibacter sp. Y32M11]|uniref:MFS transporter n=1 Tax=Paeniglutamicibacter sp. Y32M11 TaxID=2853258 RepID=UPI00104603D1|nr:MFS transporter [Paeniglutamicibacter sp. Y32M11]QXQ10693.1 MFS transporter [Paeniglutamicibacter sp. Y32M11]